MKFGRHLRAWVGALALVGVLMSAGPAAAQSPEPPVATPAPITGPVLVEVGCIRATMTNDRVDPALQPMLKHLAHTRFTGFTLISTNSDDLAVGTESTFSIEGGRRLRVQLIDRDATAARLRLRLLSADGTRVLDTTVAVHRNRIFIVAGPHLDGGDVLIIPVTAKY